MQVSVGEGWTKQTLLPLVAIMRRSRIFCQGGVQTFFTVYRGGPMVLSQRKLYFSKDPEGVQHFPRGGGQTFSGRKSI